MRRTPRALAVVVLLLVPGGARLAAAANMVELAAPRAFGYVIGDVFIHEALITLEPGATLVRASLPQPGLLGYWLELTAVELVDLGLARDAHRYRLHLRYQTFYAPLEPKVLATPALNLEAMSLEGPVEVTIPAWSFLMSPLREIISTPAGASIPLQSDVVPRLHSLAPGQRLAMGAAALAIIALAMLGGLRGWGPLRRKHRPFGLAARKVAHCLVAPTRAENYLGALLALHRAFDAAAGRRLLAEDLKGFLDLRPGFRCIAGEIARFFAASRQAFFGAGAEYGMALLSDHDLALLARRLASLERSGA